MKDLEWPAGFERTPPVERYPHRSFEVSLGRALDELEAELERLGVDDWRLSTDAEKRKRDSRPYARANPDDPSVVVYWTMDGEQFAVGCDQYSELRDNFREIGHYIHEKRKMEQRAVATGEAEFSNARLPSGDDDAIIADAPPAHEILGVSRNAREERVRDAFRSKVKEVHPDTANGDEYAFKRLKRAREVMLDG